MKPLYTQEQFDLAKSTDKLPCECYHCSNIFYTEKRYIKSHLKNVSSSKNKFCNRSCNATYRNLNKTTGNRRSKLEIYIEEQLTILYPNLLIDFNQKSAIGSELDIFIPSLNIAFELNGIFHYEPIFGTNKLDQIQSNDKNKFQLCIEHKIDLCIIDTSAQKYVKPSTSQKYLDIIINIINERITRNQV